MGNNRGKRRRRWVWLSLLVIVVAGGVFGVRSALRGDHTIDPSQLATVERGDIARSVVATGVIEPRAKVEVKSKASGIVKQIFVDYGDRVRQGQILVELDKEDLRARVREAEANLLGAQASLEAAKATLKRNEAEAEGPDLPFLKSAMERARNLHQEELIAQSALDDTEMAYRLALNRQTMAVRNLGVSRAEVSRAEAQVAQARALLDRAQEDLSNSTIVSPMDGLVLSRDVEVGDAVSSILVLGSQATLMLTLGDVSSVYVLGKVDEADVGQVFLGQPARIVVESFKDRKFAGAVTKISPLGVKEENVTTFEVRVSIDNPSGELKANMSANAEIILEEKHAASLVPEVAVVYDRERNTFLEVPDPASETGRRRLPVKLGLSNGVQTELIEGPPKGQQVILQ